MADVQLDCCHNRHRAKSLTNSKKARGDEYTNTLWDHEFPIKQRMGLTSDITYLRTDDGFYSNIFRKMELAGISSIGGALYSYWPADLKGAINKEGDLSSNIDGIKRFTDMAADHGIFK